MIKVLIFIKFQIFVFVDRLDWFAVIVTRKTVIYFIIINYDYIVIEILFIGIKLEKIIRNEDYRHEANCLNDIFQIISLNKLIKA